MMVATERRRNRSSSIENVYRPTSARYCDSAFKYMRNMQQLRKFCDITVRVAGTEYFAHKVILAAASQDFAALHDGEENQPVVNLDSMSSAVFEIILEYAYSGNVIITNENVGDLFAASQILRMGTLEEACSEALPVVLTASNCCKIIAIAGEQRCEEVYEKCKEYALQHFPEIVTTDAFLELSIDEVKALVANRRVVLEEEMYSAMLKWVKHDLENRRHSLFELTKDFKFFTNNTLRGSVLELQPEPIVPRGYLEKQLVPYIFATGGFSKLGSELHECEAYNPRTNKWHGIASLQSRRESHAVIGFGQHLYAFGGYNDIQKVLSTVEFYDPIKDAWAWTTPMPYGRQGHGICALNDSIYICGGLNPNDDPLSTVELFDPSTGLYKTCAAMNNKRALFKLAATDDCIYAIGGWNGQLLDSVERFDPREGIWSPVPAMIRGKAALLGVAVLNEYIYCTGGYHFGTTKSSVERFDIRNNSWEAIRSMCKERRGHELVTLDGCIYGIGGLEMNAVEKFDPEFTQWIEIKSMTHKRWSCGASALDCIGFNHS